MKLLYELVPIRPKDATRLIHWVLSEYVTLLRLLINLLLVLLRLLKFLIASMWRKIAIFAVGFYIFSLYGFSHLWLLLTGFSIIYINLSDEARKPGELSAYNIFNVGFKRIIGDLDADQIDQQLRHGGVQI